MNSRFDQDSTAPRSRVLGAFLFGAFLLGALLSSCQESSEAPHTNVLIVTFDTTRTDALSCYSGPAGVSPTIDAFASHGVLFEQAYTPAPLTLPAHSSLLTGRTPDQHGVRANNAYSLPHEEITLAEILSEEGYATAAFVGSYVLDSQYGLAQGFAHYGDDIDVAGTHVSRVAERPAENVTDDALAWLASWNGERPFFLWVHYYDPHFPHELQPGQTARFEELYHDEVAYCDGQLARLKQALEQRQSLSNTLVVFTADHGEGHLEHGESTHGYFLYQGTQHVPLILSHPNLGQGERVDSPASLMDVVPTVLGFLGLECPDLPGSDLLAATQSHREPIYMEAELPRIDFGLSPLRGVVDGHLKLIDAPQPELYDVSADPGETRNLARQEAARVQLLRGWLREREVSRKGDAEFMPDAASTEKLLGLGYAGTVDHAVVSREDWKMEELVTWANLLNTGLRHFQAGDLKASIASLEKLVLECDSSYGGQLYLGMALVQTDSIERGLAHLERATELQPDSSAEAYWNIAVAKAKLGRLQGLDNVLLEVIAIDPTHLRARQKLAEGALGSKDWAQARVHLEALIQHGPKSPEGKWAKARLAQLP